MTRSFLKLAAAIVVGGSIISQAQADEWYFPYKTPYAVRMPPQHTEKDVTAFDVRRRGEYKRHFARRPQQRPFVTPSRSCTYRGGPKSNQWVC